MDKQPAIELKNITKRFGNVVANKNVNLTAYRGEILSILGENGSGKTTLMNMISGIYFPDSGQIFIDGKEVKLTQTEYNIVELLSVHAGRVLTYSEIIKKIWGYSDSGSIKKLQVNMANIRKKFKEQPGEYRYILNELGVGYRMNHESEERNS